MSPAVAAIIAAVALLAVVVVVVLLVRGRRKGAVAEVVPDETGPKPAGWYADPVDDTQVRWWDGSAWTEHLQDKPEA